MARRDNLPHGDIGGDDLPHGGIEGGDYDENVEGGHGHRSDRGYGKLQMQGVPKKYRTINSDFSGPAPAQGGVFPGDMVPPGDDVKGAVANGQGPENDETGDQGEGGGRADSGDSDRPGPNKVPNYERMVYDPETGASRDRYAGGFLPRDGYSRER